MKTRLVGVIAFAVVLNLMFAGTLAADGPTKWTKVASGFGSSGIWSLASFNHMLYAGSYDINGAQLWRSANGMNWTQAMTGGFGSLNNAGIDHMLSFQGMLYVGTEVDVGTGGEVWRSADGTNWAKVVSSGFGDVINAEVFRFTTYNSNLYASTYVSGTHGSQIWRSATGNQGNWNVVETNGFGDTNNIVMPSSAVYNGYLYMGTWNKVTGTEVWRTSDGTNWTQVNSNGFGSSGNKVTSALTSFNGYLYAGTYGASDATGHQVWRCSACNGTDWTAVYSSGQAVTYRNQTALEVFQNQLYFVMGNGSTGVQVWRSSNGTTWEQVGFAGFGDTTNRAPYWDNSVLVFNNRLYVGTINYASAGQIWELSPFSVFLPMIVK